MKIETIKIETETTTLPNSVIGLLKQNLKQQTDKTKQKEIKQLIQQHKQKEKKEKSDFSKYLNFYYPIWFKYKDYEIKKNDLKSDVVKEIRENRKKIITIETDITIRTKTKNRKINRIKKQILKLDNQLKSIDKVFDNLVLSLKKQLNSKTNNLKFKTYGFNSNFKDDYKTYMSIEFENKPKRTKRNERKKPFKDNFPYQLENYQREKKVITELQNKQKLTLKRKMDYEIQNRKSYYNNNIIANLEYLNTILRKKINLIELMYLMLVLKQLEIYKQKKKIVIKTVKQLGFLNAKIPINQRYLYNEQQLSLILNKSKNKQKINETIDYLMDLNQLGLIGFKMDYLKQFCYNDVSKMKVNKIMQELKSRNLLVKKRLIKSVKGCRVKNAKFENYYFLDFSNKPAIEKSFVLV